MKKTKVIFFISMLSVLLVMSSCAKTEKTSDFYPHRSFAVHMKAEKSDKIFEADIICRSYEDIEIAFTYPKELSGFTVTLTGENYNINVFGISDEITKDELNDSSLLNILIGTIRIAVFTNHGCFVKEADKYSADLLIDSVPVNVTFSQDGYICSMNVPSISFSAQFEYSG